MPLIRSFWGPSLNVRPHCCQGNTLLRWYTDRTIYPIETTRRSDSMKLAIWEPYLRLHVAVAKDMASVSQVSNVVIDEAHDAMLV